MFMLIMPDAISPGKPTSDIAAKNKMLGYAAT
jgi:hypothetical protein